MEADDVLVAIKEIETYRVRGVNICSNYGEKSVITNLRALEKCDMHRV